MSATKNNIHNPSISRLCAYVCVGAVIQLVAAASLCAASAVSGEAVSQLWGEAGERWSPKSRLPDFSTAGYRQGTAAIPDVPAVANARDFGAVGDGVTDDTAALQAALAATTDGTLLIPAGRYVLTDRLRIEKPNVVLRGAGSSETVFVIQKSLEELEGASGYEALGVAKSNYSFGGAFVEVAGAFHNPVIGNIVEPAQRGTDTLVLDAISRIHPGDTIQIRVPPHPELAAHLHAKYLPMGEDTKQSKYYLEAVAKIRSIDGKRLRLETPLRTDVRPEWKPFVRKYSPAVTEIGIEGIGFEFSGKAKRPHLQEEGFNGITFHNVGDSWVRDVRFTDADMGIKLARCTWITIEDTRFDVRRRQGDLQALVPFTGHHGIWVTGNSHNCLIQDFVFETWYHHDLSIEGFSSGNVFRRGTGLALNFDHHRNAPYENLFTDIDVGDVSRVWASAGREDRGPHSAARPTFWNIRYRSGSLTANAGRYGNPAIAVPDWPQINVIGLAEAPASTDPAANAWVEPLPAGVRPPDLYQAQKEARIQVLSSSP